MLNELLIKLDDIDEDEDDKNVLWGVARGHIFRLVWEKSHWTDEYSGARLINPEDDEYYLRFIFVEEFSC